jgi:N-acetylneuraminic acid mutarotase
MNGQRRRVIALTTAGILVAGLLAGGGGWWLGQRDQARPAAVGVTSVPTTGPHNTTINPPSTPTQPTPTSPVRVGTWQRLPAAPIPTGLYEFAGVWTGNELLLYGAAQGRGVGAAYNPATNSWRKLPAGPGPAQAMEGGYKAVWTGTEMLGWGLGLDGAYNPATNHWRRLAGPTWSGSIWTGRQVLTWGGGCCDDESDQGAAYTPATDTWRPFPPSPLTGRHAPMAWTGRELIIAGGSQHGKALADAAAYNPSTRTWRRLPPMPEPRAGATATWDGREVLIVGGTGPGSNVQPYVRLRTDGVAYDPATNGWRRLPAMGDAGRTEHTAVWTGTQLLVWGGRTYRAGAWTTPPHGVAYDPGANHWSALPRSVLRGRTGQVAVWTGTQMLIWGGWPVTVGGTLHDGAAYIPTPL